MRGETKGDETRWRQGARKGSRKIGVHRRAGGEEEEGRREGGREGASVDLHSLVLVT